MTFDHAQYQSDRIRDLTRQVNGLKLLNAQLVIGLAAYIATSEARRHVDGMSQGEFMAELAGNVQVARRAPFGNGSGSPSEQVPPGELPSSV